MTHNDNSIAFFDFTRAQLHAAVKGRLPESVDPAAYCAATAYWICLSAPTPGEKWQAAFHKYTDTALLERAGLEAESERRELDLLRAELRQARGPVLDVGAGWGRLADLYAQARLAAYFVEPTTLGTRLMQRSRLSRIITTKGETLPFPGGVFHTVMIGWVLHHDAGDVDAAHLLREAARVTTPGGLLLSVEPLDERFDQAKWTTLVTQAGFEVRRCAVFYEYPRPQGGTSNHSLLVGTYTP